MDVRLTRPLERAIASGHPWIYREAIAGDPAPGEIVTVRDRRGRFVARGVADRGPIAVRVWTTRDEPLEPLLSRRVLRALELRADLDLGDTNAYRLLNGEGDRTPGVVVDRYASHATVRFDGEGSVRFRDELCATLPSLLEPLGVRTLLMRTGRKRNTRTEVVHGELGDGRARVREHGMNLLLDPIEGQKTGLFLDHRESRRLVRGLSEGRRVLNLYGYTGGFSVAAGLGHASQVRTVDIAPEAIALANETWTDNALPTTHEAITSDVPAFLEEDDAPVDLIVCDPPSFAPNEAALASALESYRGLHQRCLERLRPGGYYLAASCSSHVDRSTFDATLVEGARRARKTVQILGRFGAPADHPHLLAFPEGDYLKVTLCRVLA